jgi:hypothetical protein
MRGSMNVRGLGTDGGRRNGVLPIEALCKKASMSAAYAADPFYFVRSFESENLRDIGAVE